MPRLICAALCLGLALTAGARTIAHERVTTTVTWDREISAIFRARCVTCHRDGGSAPMAFDTYARARPWARAIRYEVMTRRMPVWHAARGYGDFSNDPSLSPFEIALIAAWVDGGAPRFFVPRGSPLIRTPGPPETPLAAQEVSEPRPTGARRVTMDCAERTPPPGRLLGLRPTLTERGSLRVMVSLPDGREESLGWFRNFDPKFAPTYWLRTAFDLPAGSRLRASDAAGASAPTDGPVSPSPCRLDLVYAAPGPVEDAGLELPYRAVSSNVAVTTRPRR